MPNAPPNSTNTPTTPVLGLRRAEAAKAIGVSTRKLDELIASNRVPYVRLDGCVIFPIDALRKWLTSQLQGESTTKRSVK